MYNEQTPLLWQRFELHASLKFNLEFSHFGPKKLGLQTQTNESLVSKHSPLFKQGFGLHVPTSDLCIHDLPCEPSLQKHQ